MQRTKMKGYKREALRERLRKGKKEVKRGSDGRKGRKLLRKRRGRWKGVKEGKKAKRDEREKVRLRKMRKSKGRERKTIRKRGKGRECGEEKNGSAFSFSLKEPYNMNTLTSSFTHTQKKHTKTLT